MELWAKQYPDGGLVKRAYEFAEKAHSGSKRESGEPYFSHAASVAETVHSWKLDDTSVAAALLHDVVEDTAYTAKDLEKEFGKEVASLVDGLTKLKHLKYGKDPDTENLRKLILSFAKDIRVILIKLADRYHNMQTLEFKSEKKQKEIAWETVEIYAPIAYRLGIQKISGELQDLAFPFLYKEEHKWLMEAVKDRYETREKYAKEIKPELKKILEKEGIHPVSVDSRAKRYFSLYRKLLRYNMELDKIYDLVAIRVILQTIEECYATLGVIHSHWPPLPGRFKDYIAVPKPNGYRSLHTTVSSPGEKIIEVQIRTKEMHEENEFGIAAHWAYEQIKADPGKDKKTWKGARNKKELSWVKQLQNWQKSNKDEKDFLETLKTEFFKERIFVMTPMGDVIDLPVGATPIDFAYHIHSEIGNQCIGAKVNERITPLDYELKSGDLVEILTQKGKKPSRDWLDLVKTAMAKKYIRSSLSIKAKGLVQKEKKRKHTEYRIISENKPGLLRELAEIFTIEKIKVISVNAKDDPKLGFFVVLLKLDFIEKKKAEAINMRLRKIKEIKEVHLRETD